MRSPNENLSANERLSARAVAWIGGVGRSLCPLVDGFVEVSDVS
jgi:hypothetical protein